MADMQVSVTLPAPELISLAVMNGTLCRMFAEPSPEITLAVLKDAVAQLEAQIAATTPVPPPITAAHVAQIAQLVATTGADMPDITHMTADQAQAWIASNAPGEATPAPAESEDAPADQPPAETAESA